MSVAAELAMTKDAAVAVIPSFSWLVANAATGYKSMFDYFQPFVGRGRRGAQASPRADHRPNSSTISDPDWREYIEE
jgi:hypothetical protein